MNNNYNLKIDILPNSPYLNTDKTFNKKDAINLSGKIAGICYDPEGFSHLENESPEKTLRRVNMTLNNGHHSVYDHINISFNLQNIPKMLAMVINNEKDYTTSEKSARYTKIKKDNNSIITDKEEELYNKWLNIFKIKIKEQYGDIYNDNKIQKLAQENSRYLVTVFMPTQMIYTTSLRQINYLASWMNKYINEANNKEFDYKLANSMQEFLKELEQLNVLEPKLMQNEKNCSLSLFGKDLNKKEEYFGDVYSTNYQTSLAELAQAQRHRTLNYKMELNDDKTYFVPPIIENNQVLIDEWLTDLNKVKDNYPQGELVTINEQGIYENFILKTKERLCTAAQLEIMQKTRDTLLKYQKALKDKKSPLAQDIEKYSHGARCTFPDYQCLNDCHFKEGKILIRKI